MNQEWWEQVLGCQGTDFEFLDMDQERPIEISTQLEN